MSSHQPDQFLIMVSRKWALVAATIISSAVSLDVGSQTVDKHQLNVIPNHFIVQFNSLDASSSSRHADFETSAKAAGLTVDIKSTFTDQSIFHGVYLETPSISINETLNQLNALPLVEKAWPSQMYYQPDYKIQSILDATTTSPSDIEISQRLSTLTMTKVDKLHEEGIYGEGIKVGIIDSGVDYRLPELGGGFGPGYLVGFGYDFVGDNVTAQAADDDPLTTCSSGGHGTHVSKFSRKLHPLTIRERKKLN